MNWFLSWSVSNRHCIELLSWPWVSLLTCYCTAEKSMFICNRSRVSSMYRFLIVSYIILSIWLEIGKGGGGELIGDRAYKKNRCCLSAAARRCRSLYYFFRFLDKFDAIQSCMELKCWKRILRKKQVKSTNLLYCSVLKKNIIIILILIIIIY